VDFKASLRHSCLATDASSGLEVLDEPAAATIHADDITLSSMTRTLLLLASRTLLPQDLQWSTWCSYLAPFQPAPKAATSSSCFGPRKSEHVDDGSPSSVASSKADDDEKRQATSEASKSDQEEEEADTKPSSKESPRHTAAPTPGSFTCSNSHRRNETSSFSILVQNQF
jgi:hypothetical protein